MSARSSLRWYFSSCGGSIGLSVLEQPRLPLRGLAGQEAVEVVEADALAGGPAVERAHRRRLGRPACCATCRTRRSCSRSRPGPSAIVAEVFGNHAGIAVPIHRALGDRAGADAMMVAAGQQRRARRRADRRRMEGVVADALVRDARQRRRVDRPAEGVGQAEAHVVEQDDQDVGRILVGRCFGSTRRWWSDSCSVGAATLADGAGGKGSTEPSLGVADDAAAWLSIAAPRTPEQQRRLRMVRVFIDSSSRFDRRITSAASASVTAVTSSDR